jgi:hypothetical protein
MPAFFRRLEKQGWAHQGRNTRTQPTNQKLRVFVGERESAERVTFEQGTV